MTSVWRALHNRADLRPLHIAFIYGSHLLALVLAIYTTRAGGVRVEVLLYAFLIDYVFRLGTIQVLHNALSDPRLSWARRVAPYISRLPRPGQQSLPVTDGERGKPAGIGRYLAAMAFCSFLAFVLANVNADREIDLALQAGLRDMTWAFMIAGLYWINSLLTRTMVIHPAQPLTTNFGYNSKELTILALAVLTGGLVVVARQSMGLPPSAWTVMGPLLVFRTWYDLWASLDAVESGASTNP